MSIIDWYLNIQKLPKITKASKDYLATLKPYKASLWDLTNSKMKVYKKELLDKLLVIQKNRCVYCGLSLARRSADREHFVHKAATTGYQEFMFNADNLFAACEFCNRRLKGQKKIISHYDPDYTKCTFNIVHPFYNNPDDYIKFHPSKTDPVVARPTDADCGKGKNTIKMFNLNSFEMWKEREGYIRQQELDKSRFKDILQSTRK